MAKSVRVADSSSPATPSTPVKLPSDSLYIYLNGEAKGPFTEDQLRALLTVKSITNDTPCRHGGAAAWLTVAVYIEDVK